MKKIYIMIAVIVMVSVAVGAALASMGGKFLNPEKYQAMIEKKAEMFDMDVEEVNARLEQGETLKEIFGWDSIAKEDIMAKKQAWMQNGTNDCPEECKRCGGHWKGRMGWGMMGQFHKEK